MADLSRDWDVAGAVYWIAFRGSPPVLLQHSEQQDDATRVMEALQARAARNPRSWRPDPDTMVLSAWRTRALVRRWVLAEGIAAAEVLEKASLDNPQWVALMRAEEHERRKSEALSSLNAAVSQEHLQAWTRCSSTRTKPDNPQPRKPLLPRYIEEKRRIDMAGDLILVDEDGEHDFLKDHGILCENGKEQYFYDVSFRVADIQNLWPAPNRQIKEINLQPKKSPAAAHARPSDDAVRRRLEEFKAERNPELAYPTEVEIEKALAVNDKTRNASRPQLRAQRDNHMGGGPERETEEKSPLVSRHNHQRRVCEFRRRFFLSSLSPYSTGHPGACVEMSPMQPTRIDPVALPIAEAVTFSGMSRSAVYRELANGNLRAVKSGSRTLVLVESIRSYLASLPAATFRSAKAA